MIKVEHEPRRFPALAWAWPSGELDQLLQAALCPDPTLGLAAFKNWLNKHDIDRVSFREHRLLASISARFGKELISLPEYPRLVGLQRQLWTRSRMAFAEAVPVLKEMLNRGIKVMLLKGGARIAVRPDDQKSRVAHDLDILVPPSQFVEAMAVLFNAGWSSSSGESQLCLQAHARAIRAMNFFHGRFGDIDLHQWGYGGMEAVTEPEAGLWGNAIPAVFFGLPVLVPAATDRVALAICHSGLDAHAHSDWLVDCAQLIAEETLEWEHLLAILAEMRALVQAQVALGYLSQRIGIALSPGFTSKLMNAKDPSLLRRISNLLQAKPRTDWGVLSRIARGVAKQARLMSSKNNQNVVNIARGRIGLAPNPSHTFVSTTKALLCDLALQDVGPLQFQLNLMVTFPGPARRVEFELNTENRHLMRLRARNFWSRNGQATVRFEGQVQLSSEDVGIWIEARPSRVLREGEIDTQIARYAALPFSVMSFSKTCLRKNIKDQ